MCGPLKGTHSEPNQHRAPGMSNRQRAALKKGKAGRGACKWSGGDSRRSPSRWEASDQRRGPETPLSREWRFVRLSAFSVGKNGHGWDAAAVRRGVLPKDAPPKTATCHRVTFPVLSELPIKRLTQATQAWVEHARRGASKKSPVSLVSIRLYVAKAHIGKGIIREKQRPRRVETGGRMELIDDSRV